MDPKLRPLCKQCGGALNRRGAGAIFCFPCARQRVATRIAAPGRRRSGNLKPLMIDGVWSCVDCREPIGQDVIGGKKRRPALRCSQCKKTHQLAIDVLSGRQAASSALARAVQLGQVQRAADRQCADCSRPAECYDHRDYGRPLQVDPVCRSCNVIRGPAIPVHPYFVGLVLLASTEAKAA